MLGNTTVAVVGVVGIPEREPVTDKKAVAVALGMRERQLEDIDSMLGLLDSLGNRAGRLDNRADQLDSLAEHWDILAVR